MKEHSFFSQENLNELLSRDRNRQQEPSDTRSPSNHPALSTEKDISNHYSLTNSPQNLSRLGRDSDHPKYTENPPTQGEINSTIGRGHERSLEQMGMNSPGNIPDDPLSTNVAPNTVEDPTTSFSTTEQLISSVLNIIMSHEDLSQTFIQSMIDNLFSNPEFMVQLRSQLLQKLMNERM